MSKEVERDLGSQLKRLFSAKIYECLILSLTG